MWNSKRSDRSQQLDSLNDLDVDDAPPAPPAPKTELSPPRRAVVEEPKTIVSPGSVLGRTLVFKGDLTADEDLVLQGRVEGSIKHTASLTIGPDGSTKGNITAKSIIVEGQVEGDLIAESSISVRSGGSVRGGLKAPRVALADGARFNGMVDMGSDVVQSKSKSPERAADKAIDETPPAAKAGNYGG
jgi:cytoskeletal protein CcmA (bactofilin family)